MATEIEMKLAFETDVSAPAIEPLLLALKHLSLDLTLQQAFLENSYFDTPDFQLNQSKVALRIRRKTGLNTSPAYIQTFKTAGQSQDGLSQRGEWEWPLPEKKLDCGVLNNNQFWPRHVKAEKLVTVFETNFTRYSADIHWQGSLIELVLDFGEIISNGKSEAIHEIELELKGGSKEALINLSEHLRSTLPIKTFDTSKAQRGFQLFQS